MVRGFFLDLFRVYLCCSLFSFMHVSLHFCLVSFTLAHLRMLSFVFSHVCVLGRSYTCVVVSCLGSCVCDAMLESRGSLLSRIHYCHGRKDSLDV